MHYPAFPGIKLPANQNPVKWLYFVGMSMYPTLRNLDILAISPIERKDIHRGDIVVFKSPISGRMISHRVVALNNDNLSTVGDNMNAPDSAVAKYDSVVGRIEYLDRGLKSIPVRNGFAGLLSHYILRTRKRILGFARLKSILQSVKNRFFRSYSTIPSELTVAEYKEVKAYLYNYPDAPVGRLFFGDQVIGKTTNDFTKWKIDPKHIAAVDPGAIPSPKTLLNNYNGSLFDKIKARE